MSLGDAVSGIGATAMKPPTTTTQYWAAPTSGTPGAQNASAQAQTAQSDTAQGWDFPGNPYGSNPNGQLGPITLSSQQQQQLAQGIGLVDAQYNQQSGDLSGMYGINRQQQQLQNQMTGLSNQDINGNIADQGADIAYHNKLIGLQQSDIASYGQDRQTLGQMLTNDLSGFHQDKRMADFATNNKYIGGGGQFSPGMGINLANNAFGEQNKAANATYQNQMQNTGIDRSINGANQMIDRSQRMIAGDQNSVNQLNNSLAKNGLQLQLGNLSLDQLKQEFNSRMAQLGANRGIDTNKIFDDMMSGDNANAANIIQQVLPDYLRGK